MYGVATTAYLTAQEVLASVQDDGSRSYLKVKRATDSKAGDECPRMIADTDMDMGILGCSEGFRCLDDASSSTGGRCFVIEETERRLVSEITCNLDDGTPSYKCKGGIATQQSGQYEEACQGINPDNVGCGSCNG